MITEFVRREGAKLTVAGAEFRIAGANNYYVGYVEEPLAAAVLDLAASMGLNVIRLWAFENAQHLDRAIALAGERNLRVILTLTNYWPDFGGMPAYLKRFGLGQPEEFYRDGRCRAAYWLDVEPVISRHRDNPTVLAWELANEPRCPGVNDGEELLLSWIWEMATLIRATAPRQLVAVGDECFFSRRWARGNTLFNGSHGVNFEAILGVGPVDFGTYHLYGQWANDQNLTEWGRMWISEHNEAAERAGKPVLLEEYGVKLGPGVAPEHRAAVYENWLRLVEDSGNLGALVWMIGVPEGPGQPYTPDDYVLGESGPEADVIRAHAARLLGRDRVTLKL